MINSKKGGIYVRTAYFKYIGSLFIFGLNGIIASFIILTSYEIVLMRTAIGSLFLLLVITLSKQKLKKLEFKEDIIYLVVSGVALGLSWIFLFEAYVQIGVSLSTIIYYSGPIIVIGISPLMLNEKVNMKKIVSLILVFLGLILINSNIAFNGENLWGVVYGLLSAIMYAVMIIATKRQKEAENILNSMYRLTVSFSVVFIYTLIKGGININGIIDNVGMLIILGVFNTGFGCYLYFSSISKLPVGTVAILGYLEPLSAVFFSIIILKEHLAFIQIIGVIFVFGGAILGELIQNKKKFSGININTE